MAVMVESAIIQAFVTNVATSNNCSQFYQASVYKDFETRDEGAIVRGVLAIEFDPIGPDTVEIRRDSFWLHKKSIKSKSFL